MPEPLLTDHDIVDVVVRASSLADASVQRDVPLFRSVARAQLIAMADWLEAQTSGKGYDLDWQELNLLEYFANALRDAAKEG